MVSPDTVLKLTEISALSLVILIQFLGTLRKVVMDIKLAAAPVSNRAESERFLIRIGHLIN